MKEIRDYEKDLSSIRTMMERSVKFLSLSGLSGVLAGTYALLGSLAVYFILYYPHSPFSFQFYYVNDERVVFKLIAVAGLVLFFSLITGFLLSIRKAKKLKMPIWNFASRQLFVDLFIPLASGGLLIIILLAQGYYGIVAPSCLVFYGLALIHGSRSTYEEVRYLGFIEIILGLACAVFPGFGLIFWGLGFGVMHIVYGSIMYFRYER
ncbi:MAG TPA: hypothetical protein VGQ59_09270 [Cyclobacteriaceae bacterium]|jgi:hypothetical protein|nr:hypothetical protein [Cyclobacteriaceae bacterium]